MSGHSGSNHWNHALSASTVHRRHQRTGGMVRYRGCPDRGGRMLGSATELNGQVSPTTLLSQSSMMKKLELPNPELRKNVSLIAQRFGYKTMEVENGICLENALNEPPFEFVRITPNNIGDAKPILERYQNEYSTAGEYVIEYSRCLKLLSRV